MGWAKGRAAGMPSLPRSRLLFGLALHCSTGGEEGLTKQREGEIGEGGRRQRLFFSMRSIDRQASPAEPEIWKHQVKFDGNK